MRCLSKKLLPVSQNDMRFVRQHQHPRAYTGVRNNSNSSFPWPSSSVSASLQSLRGDLVDPAPSLSSSQNRVGVQQLAVNQTAYMDRVFTQEDVTQYGLLIGDMNPLHQSLTKSQLDESLHNHPLVSWQHAEAADAALDEEQGETDSEEKLVTKSIVHGMLVGSMISSVIAYLFPGTVYLSQTLSFRRAVYANQTCTAQVTILSIDPPPPKQRVGVTCKFRTTVQCNDRDVIRGEALCWITTRSAAAPEKN